MYRWKLLRRGLILLTVGGLLTWYIVNVEQRDYQEYQKLVASSEPAPERKADVARQSRQQVEKNLWFSERGERLHTRMTADSSELRLTMGKGKNELTESMERVRVFMQERLFWRLPDGKDAVRREDGQLWVKGREAPLPIDTPGLRPMQVIRYLEADQGVQDYQENRFVADNVTMSRFLAEGHDLVSTMEGSQILMKGLARSIQFSLGGKSLNFQAQELRATFFSSEEML